VIFRRFLYFFLWKNFCDFLGLDPSGGLEENFGEKKNLKTLFFML